MAAAAMNDSPFPSLFTRRHRLTPVQQELERRGVDSVRALLLGMSDGYSGTARTTPLRLGDGGTISRGEMEDWLRQKERTADRWIKAGAIAAILAAVFAFLAWIFPIGH